MIQALRYMLLFPTAMIMTLKPLSQLLLFLGVGAPGNEHHVAFFIFGDSISDAGNNNYLPDAPKTNFWPYGETFFHYPTGRSCDGRILADFIAEYAKMALIKPYLQPNFTDYTYGANFASAGAGVLPQTRPGTLYLGLQVHFLEVALERLKKQKGDKKVKELISEAVYHFSISADDYLNFGRNTAAANTTVSLHEKEVFVGWVVGNMTTSIKKVYEMGGRKFSFQNCGPIGCLPFSKYEMGINVCWNETEQLAQIHNIALPRALAELEKELPGFKYVLFDFYTTLLDRIVNYTKFGFEVAETACCGSGAYNGNFTCGSTTHSYSLCPNPSEYLFFDSAHPTDHANSQLSSLMWSGDTSVIAPHNLKSYFQ